MSAVLTTPLPSPAKEGPSPITAQDRLAALGDIALSFIPRRDPQDERETVLDEVRVEGDRSTGLSFGQKVIGTAIVVVLIMVFRRQIRGGLFFFLPLIVLAAVLNRPGIVTFAGSQLTAFAGIINRVITGGLEAIPGLEQIELTDPGPEEPAEEVKNG